MVIQTVVPRPFIDRDLQFPIQFHALIGFPSSVCEEREIQGQ